MAISSVEESARDAARRKKGLCVKYQLMEQSLLLRSRTNCSCCYQQSVLLRRCSHGVLHLMFAAGCWIRSERRCKIAPAGKTYRITASPSREILAPTSYRCLCPHRSNTLPSPTGRKTSEGTARLRMLCFLRRVVTLRRVCHHAHKRATYSTMRRHHQEVEVFPWHRASPGVIGLPFRDCAQRYNQVAQQTIHPRIPRRCRPCLDRTPDVAANMMGIAPPSLCGFF